MKGDRFAYLNTWGTNGIQAFRHVADTKRNRPHHPVTKTFIPNIENKLADINELSGEQGPLAYFGAIVGIDPGHVYPAAAFSLPTDPSQAGSQLKLSNNFLYGKEWRNRKWLEERKARCGILSFEDALSKETKHGVSLASFSKYVRVWQVNRCIHHLSDFYNSLAVGHRQWDSKMSSASAVDKGCELLERLGGPTSLKPCHEKSQPDKPTLFVLGDAQFACTRRGLKSSKHSRLAARFIDRIKKRCPGALCVGIDEYKTSQRCPRCLGELKKMRRKPRGAGELRRKEKGVDGLVEDFRVQHCSRYVSSL
jgi:hypothetical protein